MPMPAVMFLNPLAILEYSMLSSIFRNDLLTGPPLCLYIPTILKAPISAL
jgi:hypothetical protein